MSLLSNLYELVTDSSFRKVEEEAGKELIIAISGNNAETRDKLLNALSSRVESLWTPNPFRVLDIDYFPALQEQESEGGLLLFAVYTGERITPEQQNWLKELSASGKVRVIVTVLPKQTNNEQSRRPVRRLQVIIPRRFGGADSGGATASADGAGSIPSGEVKAGWEIDLENLQDEKGSLKVVTLTNLNLNDLERELLSMIVKALPDHSLALARRAPIFRNTVATHFVMNAANENAQVAFLGNVFSRIPFLSGLYGSGADYLLLTKNQFELTHRLAAIYGQKRNTRVELLLELAPVILSGVIWRTVSRSVTKKLPALMAFIPKVGIAFAATFVVGKIAQWYYASGRVASSQVANFSRTLYERFASRSTKPSNDDNSGNLNQKSS